MTNYERQGGGGAVFEDIDSAEYEKEREERKKLNDEIVSTMKKKEKEKEPGGLASLFGKGGQPREQPIGGDMYVIFTANE